LLDETCFEELVDDLNNLTFVASGKDDKGVTRTKAFTMKSFPGNEFADEEVPTAVVAMYEHSPGYGGMNNLGRVDTATNTHYFSRAFLADVEIRLHARELKKGSIVFHPRDVTKAMLAAVKVRVRASWDRILIEYHGSVVDDSLQGERDYQDFVQGTTESMRLLRFQIRYEEHWTKLLAGETAESGEIKAIEFEAGGGETDTPATVMNEED